MIASRLYSPIVTCGNAVQLAGQYNEFLFAILTCKVCTILHVFLEDLPIYGRHLYMLLFHCHLLLSAQLVKNPLQKHDTVITLLLYSGYTVTMVNHSVSTVLFRNCTYMLVCLDICSFLYFLDTSQQYNKLWATLD